MPKNYTGCVLHRRRNRPRRLHQVACYDEYYKTVISRSRWWRLIVVVVVAAAVAVYGGSSSSFFSPWAQQPADGLAHTSVLGILMYGRHVGSYLLLVDGWSVGVYGTSLQRESQSAQNM